MFEFIKIRSFILKLNKNVNYFLNFLFFLFIMKIACHYFTIQEFKDLLLLIFSFRSNYLYNSMHRCFYAAIISLNSLNHYYRKHLDYLYNLVMYVYFCYTLQKLHSIQPLYPHFNKSYTMDMSILKPKLFPKVLVVLLTIFILHLRYPSQYFYLRKSMINTHLFHIFYKSS